MTRPEVDYVVFTHLLGAAHNPRTQGPVWGQHDSPPADAGLPTSLWAVGEAITDRHLLEVDPGAPPGEYRLEVGMYTPADGRRLAVTDPSGQARGDHVLLDAVVVVVGR
jgi:hypothetical protein